MDMTELLRKSTRYGWNVKTARYVSEDMVLLEFEKAFMGKPFHIYVLANTDGALVRGYNFYEREVPLDLKDWDRYIQ